MKKILVLILCLFITSSSAFAKNYEKKVVVNAKVNAVQDALKDVLDLYKGLITIITFDEKENKYVIEYNATTLTAEVGISKGSNQKFPKAQFSAQLTQRGNDVVMIVRKVCYTGWFGKKIVFDHQDKFYQELEYRGYEVIDLK